MFSTPSMAGMLELHTLYSLLFVCSPLFWRSPLGLKNRNARNGKRNGRMHFQSNPGSDFIQICF